MLYKKEPTNAHRFIKKKKVKIQLTPTCFDLDDHLQGVFPVLGSLY
jgi:hypothetical protein